MDKIKDLNISKNTMDTEKEKRNNELQTVISIISSEKDNKDEEIKKLNLDLEQKMNTIDSYEKEINNLKNRILEQEKINKNNSEKKEKNLEEYKNDIYLLQKEKENMQNSIQILEDISTSNSDKYNKLYFQNKNDIKKLNKEKKELANEISKLKKEFENYKKNEEKEINNKMEILYTKDKYEKKINNLNKIIEELKIRLQDIYYQLSFLQKRNIFDKNADINIRIKLMILLIRNYIDKNILFDKREFFNILMRKYRKKFFIKEKRIEYLRDNRQNNFPY